MYKAIPSTTSDEPSKIGKLKQTASKNGVKFQFSEDYHQFWAMTDF
jgi:hypothetical protein